MVAGAALHEPERNTSRAANGDSPARGGAAAAQGRLEAVLGAIAEGVVVFDEKLCVVEVNRAAERILGRPRRQLVGRDRRSARIRLFRDDGRPWREADAMLDALAAEGRPIAGLACRVLRRDRSFADVVVNASRVAWTGDREGEILLTLTDVTARRRAEISRREGEERLRAILDAAFDGVVAIDGQGTVMEFNAAAEAMFETTRPAMLGRPLEELLSERDGVAHRVLRARLAASPARRPDRHVLTCSARRASGTEFPAELSLISFVQGGRRLLAAAVRELAERDRGNPGTRESGAGARSLRAIRHELRTPLNAVLGFAQLLEREETGPLNERQRRYLGHVLRSGAHLLELIDDLLEASRPHDHSVILRMETSSPR